MKNTALNLIKKIDGEIISVTPSRETMLEDIKMMQFKIRPLTGNVFDLARQENRFLEALWKTGKIEEIISQVLPQLDKKERETFFHYLRHLQSSLGEKITYGENVKIFEFEVFREYLQKKN